MEEKKDLKIAPANHSVLQREVLSKLIDKIRQLEVDSSVKEDAEEFLDLFYEHPLELDVQVENIRQAIQFIWYLDNNSKLKVSFFGKGMWEYEFIGYETNNNGINTSSNIFKFSGKAYTFVLKDDPKEHYVFYFDDYVQNKIQLKESLSKNYENMIEFDKSSRSNTKKDSTQILKYGWHTSYYDGPLAGYVYKGKELLYFNNVEETDYERQRVYALYKLSWKEKIQARFRHWLFKTVINSKNKGLYDWYYGIGKWKDKKKPKNKTLKRVENGKRPVGHFTY